MQASRAFFASGAGFQSDLQLVRDVVQTTLGDITGTARTNELLAEVGVVQQQGFQSVVAELQTANKRLEALQQEIDLLRRDLEGLAA